MNIFQISCLKIAPHHSGHAFLPQGAACHHRWQKRVAEAHDASDLGGACLRALSVFQDQKALEQVSLGLPEPVPHTHKCMYVIQPAK